MRKHLNQYVFSPLFWIMALLIVTLFLLVFVLFTPIGPSAIARIADSSIDQLRLKGVSGSILSGLHVDEFTWGRDLTVSLKDIDINIDRYDIEKEKIFANKLSVGSLSVNLTGEKSDNATERDLTSLPNFGLPLTIDAKSLHLGSLLITKKIPDDPHSQTLLFQIKDIGLSDVAIKDGQLNFANLKGNPIILGEPLKIDLLNGSLNMNQPHEVKSSGGVLFNHPVIGDVKGEVRLEGTLTQYIFDSDFDVEQKVLGKETIYVKGQGDYKQVSFDEFQFESEHGKAKGLGQVRWTPEIRWNFDVDAENLNTKTLLPEWPATAETKLKYNGSFLDSRLENQIDILSLDGELRGHALTANGQITEREGLIRAEELLVQLGDNRIETTGAVTEPLNLSLSFDAKDLKQLMPELAGRVKGSASIKGDYKAPEIKAKLNANNLAYDTYKQSSETLFIETDLGLVGDKLQLNDGTIRIGANTLKAKGRVNEPFDLNWSLDAKNLKQLSPQLAGLIQGGGVLQGTVKKPQTSFKLSSSNVAFNDIQQGNKPLSLEGTIALDQKLILLNNIQAKSGSNIIQISGKASEPLDLNIKLNAQNLAEVSPSIAGRIKGDSSIQGSYQAPVLKTNLLGSGLKFNQTHLSNSELRLQGEVQLLDGVPMVKQLNTKIGQNVFQVSGRASSPYDLQWNIDSKNLRQIMPELSGSLIVKGQLQGTIDRPIINAVGDTKGLKFKEFKLSQGNFTASTKNGLYRIKGNLKKLQNNEQKVKSAKVELNGSIENHVVTAVVDHKEAKVNLKANGAWKKQQWTGNIQKLSIAETQAGDWRLQKPTRVSLSQKGFSSDKFCFNNKKTQACSTASYSEKGGLTAKGTLTKTSLELLKPFLPEAVDLNGTVNGSYDIKQNNGKPKGVVKFKLPKSTFSIKNEEGDEEVYGYEDSEINATINNRTIKAEASMKIINRGTFSSKAKIKLSPENGKHTIDGNAQFDIPNINFAQDLIPHSRGLRGALSSKVTFKGLLSKPQIKGNADIKNAYLRLPEAGTEITNININVRADTPNKALIKGKMLMGKGALNLTGDMDLRDIAKWKANLKISGNNIRFMNTNEIRATMSPNISLGLSPDVVSINGTVAIPEADIRLKDIPETSIDESGDTIVIGEKKRGEQVSAVKIKPNVKIQLGDKVRMDAFGLEAKLSGDVNVTHNRRDILANGSLRVQDGKFQAYGQDLAINNGRLIFNGSPKLVGMDIRATRTIDEQVVGIHLGGTLLKPKSTLFSDPLLNEESEVLSFLLTGHSLSTSSGQESALLMSAVRGLGVTGSGSLIQKIGASFGLDDVNIVTKDDLRKSELALGKRLGSRLYVRYLVGLFDQTQKIAIEYKINKVLSLEAQTTADDYGLDFIYEIERD